MGSKKQTGYMCRVALVVLLLLCSIAALVAVAVIQDSWAAKEYGTEVNTHMHAHVHAHTHMHTPSRNAFNFFL